MSGEQVAIIGTGNVGAGLGRRLASAGAAVRFGARAGKDLSALLEDIRGAGGQAEALEPAAAAAEAELVFLAVPAGAAVEAARGLGSLEGKILVDCTNPLRWEAGPVWDPPAAGSVTAALAAALPGVELLKAFNGFGAEFHAQPELPGVGGVSVFMAGDSAEAKAKLAGLAERAGFSPVDAGPLRNAAVLENTAILWIHLATAGGRGRDIALQLLRRA